MHRKDGTLARQYVTADAKRKTLAISSVYRLSDIESATHRKDGTLTQQYVTVDAIKVTFTISRC